MFCVYFVVNTLLTFVCVRFSQDIYDDMSADLFAVNPRLKSLVPLANYHFHTHQNSTHRYHKRGLCVHT